ncbi:MAG TPA: hypothetical protein VJA23_05225 [Candidatus Nanoarchaeia archaeon]|nr:hypothetical protein [Candidatus Nanoarchaeia archaeon]
MTLDQVVFESRPLDHKDERRALVSAFNGDFSAEVVQGFSTTNIGAKLFTFDGNILGVPTNTLFYIISGSAEVIVEGDETKYILQQQGDLRDRLIIPKGRGYLVTIGPNTRLSISLEEAKSERLGNLWLYGTYQGRNDQIWYYIHSGTFAPAEFASAEVSTLFNKDQAGFSAVQLKFILPFDQEVVLGGHYHGYDEAYSLWKGEAVFRLEHPLTETEADQGVAAQRREVHLTAKERNYFSNPRGIVHTAKAGPHSILVGCTAEAFQGNDSAKPYKNDWLMFKQ